MAQVLNKMLQMGDRDYGYVRSMLAHMRDYPRPASSRQKTLARLVMSNIRLMHLDGRELDNETLY